MCGLFSLLNLYHDSSNAITQDSLVRPIQSIHHRGPDSYGYHISADARCGMAHARLSIIDLSGGAQPLTHQNADISLIVNGEFYDFETIRIDLQKQGHAFQTLSDSEIALHLYCQYGLDFVDYLRGEFALILYDGTQKRLIAVRDRFGIKPLHYAINAKTQQLLLASEAKSILATGFAAQWDEDAYAQACQMQYLPPQCSLFKDIYQLEPGMMLIQNNEQALRLKRYWDMDYPTVQDIKHSNENDAKEAIHKHLSNAVGLRLRADVPVCCHLSGGIDSGAIAGIAAHFSAKPVTCFTVSFPENAGYDERPIAQEQADHIGADLHVVEVRAADMIAHIDDAVYKTEGLSINGHLAGKYLLSQSIAKAGFKVTLSGEGSDEIFAGYPHFREDIIHGSNTDNRLTQHLKTLYESNSKLAGVFLADGNTLDTSALEKILGYCPSFIKAKASLGFRIQSLLSNDFTARTAPVNAFENLARHFDIAGQLRGRQSVDSSSYLWSKLTLAGYILKTLGDGCEMAHSIEGRVPFLDHHLYEYVRSLPLDFKIRFSNKHGLIEKYILREAVKPYITQTLYKRQKHPFIAPPASTLAGLDEKLGDILHSRTMYTQAFYDVGKVQSWFNALRTADEKKRITEEPVMMMLLTTLAAQEQFALKG